jgi:hypothetical protein
LAEARRRGGLRRRARAARGLRRRLLRSGGARVDPARVAGVRIAGAQAGDAIGGAVAAAGDVNGDGLGDLGVGAQGASDTAPAAGTAYAYVILGRRGAADIDLAHLGDAGFRIEGAATGDRAGESVDGAGVMRELGEVRLGVACVDRLERLPRGQVEA